jgi:hypothetical protein
MPVLNIEYANPARNKQIELPDFRGKIEELITNINLIVNYLNNELPGIAPNYSTELEGLKLQLEQLQDTYEKAVTEINKEDTPSGPFTPINPLTASKYHKYKNKYLQLKNIL